MTKTILLATFFSACYFISTAQIQKGAVLVGGDVFFSDVKNSTSPSTNSSKSSDANISLSIGKAFATNKVAGAYVGFGQGKSEISSVGGNIGTVKNNSFKVGAFYRQYKTLGKGFYFWGEVNAGYFGGKQTNENNIPPTTTTVTQSLVELGITPGISYQVLKKLQIELLLPGIAALSYSTSKSKNSTNTNTTKGTSFDFRTGLSGSVINNLAIGFRLLL
jgi:hypothetical protein